MSFLTSSALPSAIGSFLLGFLALSWWFWLFLLLLPVTISAWLHWRRELFKEDYQRNQVLLELKMPREILKNPRAMEQVLTGIYAMRNTATDLSEIWWEGEVTRWYSLEMASFGGEVHFYIRGFSKQKALIEAAFLSYYPDLEIEEVEDYINRIPRSLKELYAQGYDIWGTEMELDNEDAYPIKTYSEFESPDENKQYDTMSTYLEVLGKLRKEEFAAIQILIAPASPKWRDTWDGLVEELRARAAKQEKMMPKTAASFPGGPLPALEVVSPQDSSEGNKFFRSFMRTPGETEVLEAVENNLSKPAFETLIRFIYLSPKVMFGDTYPRRGLAGIFKQFTALDLNSISWNSLTMTRTKLWQWPYVFPKWRNEYRKDRVLWNYRKREMAPHTTVGRFATSYWLSWNFPTHNFHMNTECLATLFHPPTSFVLTAPHIKRVESRKAGPPAGTAVFGGEEEIEKFK